MRTSPARSARIFRRASDDLGAQQGRAGGCHPDVSGRLVSVVTDLGRKTGAFDPLLVSSIPPFVACPWRRRAARPTLCSGTFEERNR